MLRIWSFAAGCGLGTIAMKAMVLNEAPGRLVLTERPIPKPTAGQVLVKVSACGVCRTDLHIVDGELPGSHLPIVPGHEVVGRVTALGSGVDDLAVGQRIGIPWIGSTCGTCWYCRHAMENLCDSPEFTGYTVDGGYADYVVADGRYCFPLPDDYDDVAAAPLLCAGLIGHRSLKAAGEADHLGIYGFGAAAHIVAQVARAKGQRVYAFTRAGDTEAQRFALDHGAHWAGASGEPPPHQLDAAIIFAPVGRLVVDALAGLRKGGRVVCGGIHMSDIPAFSYDLLWGEREIVSVANLTRDDAREFLALAPGVPVRTQTVRFDLDQANEALDSLRAGSLQGAAVLVP